MATLPLSAQTLLPDVPVRAPKWETHHGGYVVSSNFEVDPRMAAVVYPAEPLRKDDILSVHFTHMDRDDYFVLQECATLDCTQARILRVWNADGPVGVTAHQAERVWIPHEGKFFMWMQRFPMSGFSAGPFTGFEVSSPPLVLKPTGTPDQFQATDVAAAQQRGPVKVAYSRHDGASFLLRFEGGTTVLIQRMHADD